MSNSDSSSEDENLTLIREAVDSDLISDSMYTESDSKAVEDDKPQLQVKSLRNINHEDEEQFSTFKVTPQFQDYVAKHLEKMLEESLTKRLKHYANDVPKRAHKKSRIKLLSDSKHCLKVSDNGWDDTELVNRINAANAKHRIKQNCDSDEDWDRFKAVAISSETILAQTEVSHWAKRRKRQVFEYRRQKNGTLRNVEDCK